MNKAAEIIPVIVLISMVVICASISATIGYLASPLACLLLLAILLILGVWGIVQSKVPLIEYLLVLFITLILVALMLPSSPLARLILALPGAVIGYLWGGWFGSILDERNRRRKEK